MIRYTLINGITIYASSAGEFAHKLRVASKYSRITDATFISLFAEKMESSMGVVLRRTNAGEFLADLLVFGLATAANVPYCRCV